MTELEKLKAGLEYCYDDAEVDALKEAAIIWTMEYNAIHPLDFEAQSKCLKEHLGSMGEKVKVLSKSDRELQIVNMYNSGHSIDEIWASNGFKSRSSIFRILNKFGVSLNRGRFSGPLGPRKKKEEKQ